MEYMATLTIPKKITKGEELVIIPRKDYERFLHILKKKEKIRSQLDRELDEALEDVKAGRLLGPFETVREFKKAIRRHHL
jgi:hypothetical protein